MGAEAASSLGEMFGRCRLERGNTMRKLLGALKSKTIWWNVGSASVVAGLESFGGGLASIGLDPTVALLISTAVNAALRWVTKQSLDAR